MSDVDDIVCTIATAPDLKSKIQKYETAHTKWSDLSVTLMNRSGGKTVRYKNEAPVFVAGGLAAPECNANTIMGVTLFVTDHDDGQSMEESRALAELAGHEAIIVPTFSYGSTTVDIKHDDYIRRAESFGLPEEIDESSGRAFLEGSGMLVPAFAAEATFEKKVQTDKGVVYRFATLPLPKHRVIRPLAKPISFIDYTNATTSQAQAVRAWQDAYVAAALSIGGTFDAACKDATRRNYFPTHVVNKSLPAPIHVRGAAFDVTRFYEEALAATKEPKASKSKPSSSSTTTAAKSSTTDGERIHDGFNLKAWAAQYAKTYDIETLMTRKERVLGDRPNGGKFVACTVSHSGGDQETYVVNGDGAKGFTFHCSGNTGGCCDKDRLQHLMDFLAAGVITLADLQDTSLGGGTVSNRVARDVSGNRFRRARSRVKDANGVTFDAATFLANKREVCPLLEPGIDAETLAKSVADGKWTVAALAMSCPVADDYDGAIHTLMMTQWSGARAREVDKAIDAACKTHGTTKKVIEKDIKAETRKLAEYGISNGAGDWKNDYSAQFVIINAGGRAIVLNTYEPDLSKAVMAHDDFVKLHRDDHIIVDGQRGPMTLYGADEWLKTPPDDARFYRGGFVFAPGRTAPPDQYNLFGGFLVEPDESGSCSLLHELINEVWVQGDSALKEWVMEWLMHIIAYPGDKVGTALAIRGSHGDGKSIVTEKLLAPILGETMLRVANQRLVTGDYNESLAAKLLVVAEEAAFAGDKAAFAKMKELVTGDSILINPKHKAPYTLTNYARMMIISNREHFLDIEPGDRRYTVLESSQAWRGQTRKFEALLDQWSKGGAARFVFEAMNHQFRRLGEGERLVINTKIKTEYEVGQEAESREPVARFVVDFLLRGNFSAGHPIVPASDVVERHAEVWKLDEPMEIDAQTLVDELGAYYRHNFGAKASYKPSFKIFGDVLDRYYGLTHTLEQKSVRVGGKVQKTATMRVLPKRRDAIIFARRAGLLTREEMEFAGVVERAKTRQVDGYVILSVAKTQH